MRKIIDGSGNHELKDKYILVFEDIISRLDLMFKSSEKQFLKISKDLQQYYKDSREVGAKGIKVINTLTSTEYKSGIRNLSSIFNVIIEQVAGTKTNIDNTESFLNKITVMLNSASDEVAGFNKIFRHLEMQSISIKIESARLGGDDKGFRILADDIHKLAVLISDQSNGFHKKAKVLISTARDVKSQVVDLKKYEDEQSKNILQNVTLSIGSLNEKHELSITNSKTVHSKIDDIQQKTASLVTEVQFHDITRQQMEHVKSVIFELIQKINNSSSPDIDKELYSYLYKIIGLQSAQLQNSKKELFTAVENIIANLEKINNNISDINSDILTLLDSTGNNCGSFIENINLELNNILASLSKSEDVRHQFSGSIENVASTIGMLSEFIDEINKISSEVELLSLNSSIKAAHTGKEGAGLGVLAEAIQKLSTDSNKHTLSVIEILMQTTGLSESLQSLVSNDNDNIKLKSITAEISTNFIVLKNLMCNVVNGLTSTKQSALMLKEKLNKSISSFKEYLTEQKQIDFIITQLANLSHMTEEYIDIRMINELKFDGMSKNYTMQVQRDIHNSVYSDNKRQQAQIKSDNLTNEQNEFGDNVELF